MVSKQSLVRLKNVTERKSGVTLFEKTTDGSIGSCDQVASKRLSKLPKSVLHTLTRDRGSENLNWRSMLNRELIRKTGLPSAKANAVISMMVIKGLIKESGGEIFRI